MTDSIQRWHDSSRTEEEEPLLGDYYAGITSSTSIVLDGPRARRLPQYVAALSATVGGFVMGSVLGWTSPALPKLSNEYFEITTFEKDLIGGLVSLGAMFGALMGGVFCNQFGRKGALIYLVSPSFVGWELIKWAVSIEMILVGRTILGVVIGALSVISPLYVLEIGEIPIRGTLGIFFQLQVVSGIFCAYVIGSLAKSVFWFSTISSLYPVFLAAFMIFMPESPYYHLLKKNESSARASLQWLRGNEYQIDGEINLMKNTIERIGSEKLSLAQAFSTTPAKRGLVIGLGIMFFQQLCGINGVIFYSSDIFLSAGTHLDPGASTMIVGAVSIVGCYLSCYVIDRLGRKPLLFMSEFVMALTSGCLGLYFYLQETGVNVSGIGWLPVTSVSVFIFFFNLGIGPIAWMIIGEIFPPAIKGPASSIACLSNWLFSCIVTLGFGSLVIALHTSFTFWLFGAISVVGAVFMIILVPETKGKSLGEIQRELGGS